MEHNTGALIDPKDERDYRYDHVALGSAPFDWSKGFDIESELGFNLSPKDQGSNYSCVGQSFSTYAYVLNALELLPVYLNAAVKHLPEFSAKSIYSQISLGHNKGAYLRDGARLLKNYGVNKEVDVPSYENDKPGSEKFMRLKNWINSVLSSEAKHYQSSDYRVINNNRNIDLFATAIRDNGGCIIGVRGANNGTWYSLRPQKEEHPSWAHAMYAGKVRINNGKKEIGCLNSWGAKAGDRGWQWFGEEWFDGYSMFNPWTLVDKRNTNFVWLLDHNGRERKLPTYFIKSIRYLIEKRNFNFK
jgi:hypothetical protein